MTTSTILPASVNLAPLSLTTPSTPQILILSGLHSGIYRHEPDTLHDDVRFAEHASTSGYHVTIVHAFDAYEPPSVGPIPNDFGMPHVRTVGIASDTPNKQAEALADYFSEEASLRHRQPTTSFAWILSRTASSALVGQMLATAMRHDAMDRQFHEGIGKAFDQEGLPQPRIDEDDPEYFHLLLGTRFAHAWQHEKTSLDYSMFSLEDRDFSPNDPTNLSNETVRRWIAERAGWSRIMLEQFLGMIPEGHRGRLATQHSVAKSIGASIITLLGLDRVTTNFDRHVWMPNMARAPFWKRPWDKFDQVRLGLIGVTRPWYEGHYPYEYPERYGPVQLIAGNDTVIRSARALGRPSTTMLHLRDDQELSTHIVGIDYYMTSSLSALPEEAR